MNQASFPYNYIPYDNKGRPVFNGALYFGIPNLDPEIPANQIDVYGQQEDGTTVLLSQPIATGAGGVPVYGGSAITLLIDELYYSFKTLDSYGVQVYYSENVAAVLTSGSPIIKTVDTFLNLETTPAVYGQMVTIKGHTVAGVGSGDFIAKYGSAINDGGTQIDSATGGLYWYRTGYQILSADMFGVVSDGVTDQTTALTAIFTSKSTYRGEFYIPYNTKFNVSTVYNAAPVGFIIHDDSSINWGQPPGYKNKFTIIFSNDQVADDSVNMTASTHHAAITLNNFGTAGTASANSNYASIIHGVGINADKNVIDATQTLCSKAPGKNAWRWSLIQNSSYLAAKSNKWVTATSFGAGSYCYYVNNYYSTVAGGTTGATPPTHTGGSVSDGGVTWTYVGSYVSGSTFVYFDDDGTYGFQGPSSGAAFNIDATSGNFLQIQCGLVSTEIALRDKNRSRDIFRVSDALGYQLRTPESLQFTTVTGATPTVSTNGLYINNGGATTITNFVLSGSMTDGAFTALFANANTTLQNSGNLVLKGGINVNPPTNGIMEFIKYSSHSGAWIERSRSF